MTAVYPKIRRWIIPDGALRATLAAVRPAGLLGRESGALWLGHRAEIAKVVSVVVPSGAGVFESRGCWQLSPEVFASVARWAVAKKLCLLGMVHTHMPGIPPRLSTTDRNHGIQVPDFLEVVIGNAGADVNHRDWGWYVREGHGYLFLREPELSSRIRIDFELSVETSRADAHSVHTVNWDGESAIQ